LIGGCDFDFSTYRNHYHHPPKQVRDSTAQLRDDLENGTGAADPDVRALVTSLLKNYQLKDSLDAALALGAFAGSAAAKDGAVAHAKAAVEDLSIVIEVCRGR
jgi:hypothetical protein